MGSFEKICRGIEEVKIQGAENVAKAAVLALRYKKDSAGVKKLFSLRPTEPALRNAVRFALKKNSEEALKYFENADEKIARYGASLIKENVKVYTHCHASTVNRILKKAKGDGKDFVVVNTETRPLFQGRRTSGDLAKLGIKNLHYVDSAMRLAIKSSDLVMIGADSITEKKVYNKIGSGLVAETAACFNIPLYVCACAWKFDFESVYLKRETKIEERSSKEVWVNPPKGVRVLNPAFEEIDPDLIKGIVSEFGVLKFREFVKRVKKEYLWMFER